LLQDNVKLLICSKHEKDEIFLEPSVLKENPNSFLPPCYTFPTMSRWLLGTARGCSRCGTVLGAVPGPLQRLHSPAASPVPVREWQRGEATAQGPDVQDTESLWQWSPQMLNKQVAQWLLR